MLQTNSRTAPIIAVTLTRTSTFSAHAGFDLNAWPNEPHAEGIIPTLVGQFVQGAQKAHDTLANDSDKFANALPAIPSKGHQKQEQQQLQAINTSLASQDNYYQQQQQEQQQQLQAINTTLVSQADHFQQLEAHNRALSKSNKQLQTRAAKLSAQNTALSARDVQLELSVNTVINKVNTLTPV